jgi:hypothetical protein
VENAFYIPDGAGRYRSTEWTRGPWDPRAQHASPPSALLGRAIEDCEPRPDLRIARITFEILGPVPIATLEVCAAVVRPGRRVELVEATMHADGAEIMRALAWRLAVADGGPAIGVDDPPPAGPDGLTPDEVFFPTGHDVGYHSAMEWRFVSGGFMELGPAIAWMRMRHPLVADETPSPLQRVLGAADSGNGVSATVDFGRYLFINTDLSVFLHREPVGVWVCLDAHTVVEPNGTGLASSRLWDEQGPIGRGMQTLLVAPR